MSNNRILLILIASTLIFAGTVSFGVYFITSSGIPSLEQLENPPQSLATQIFSEDGEILDHFFIERRVNLPLNEIPKDFIKALISTEDKKFYRHWGLDVDRIIKAMIKNVLAGRTKEGASTITQQLARNLFLDQSINLGRKIREAQVAIQIENIYTKDEILEMYCNTVAFGRGAYGINVAAKTYFNKKPKNLTTSESAYLVGLLKAPSFYDVRVDEQRAIRRRNLVLNLMLSNKNLTEDEYYEYIEEPILSIRGKGKNNIDDIAPHFVEYIRQQVRDDDNLNKYDLYKDGLIIKTSLNSKIQKYANEAVEEHLLEYQKLFDRAFSWNKNKDLLKKVISDAIRKNPQYIFASKEHKKDIADKLRNNKKFVDSVKSVVTTIQIGLVVIEPRTGAVLSLVGASPKFMLENPDAKYSLNHVTQIRRQPGSAIKPFIYAMALSQGMQPEDMISCGPFSWTNPESGEAWRPSTGTNECPDASYKMSLVDGLRKSVNSIAARLITQVTSPLEVKNTLIKAGVASKINAVPALALGAGGEFKPLELISAYTIFANDGFAVKPFFLNEIEDKQNNIIYKMNVGNKVADVLNKEIALNTTYMLEQVVNRGTATRVRKYFKNIAAAGKTGTTNNNTDAWFVGYTPELLCGIWVGFDDQRVNFDVIGLNGQGGRVAGPIWGKLMSKIYNDKLLPYKVKNFDYTNTEIVPTNLDSLRQQPIEEIEEIR